MKYGKPDILFVSVPRGADHAVEPVMLPHLTEAGLHLGGDTTRRKTSALAAGKCAGEHGAPDLYTPDDGADKTRKYIYEKHRRK